MGALHRGLVTALLGPTNTGKTHLAVERLCAHSSGIIGFPLRLLAREVYERVVALKGAAQVALMTGEEKIIPPNARYFLCTTESMPLERTVEFLALDEAQMGADAERGHIFTDRLLHARGSHETMILGAQALIPLVQALLPDAHIISRPRFSTLSHTPPKKLSRLPKRSAIVAFSVEEVYAIAEMLRRHKGGAAVVMGALSPRTRNAQVALYQSGEVDYLVATDAIGMGLNMDIAHVGFANLTKFDGKRRRRLHLAEMAQIAGRAGRHQRDGTFGAVHFEAESRLSFSLEEVVALEGHSMPVLSELKWRNAALDFSSIRALIASLEARPKAVGLVRTDETIDMAVLRLMAGFPDIQHSARTPHRVRRLWATCQIPDYSKTGADQHVRLVTKIYEHLTQGTGHLPTDWMASALANLDQVSGDIDTVANRISGVRTWSYIAHQADWLEDPKYWAERTRALEDKLSDALHERLTQRFVDRRTAVLMKDLSARGDYALTVDADGEVAVDGQSIGTLEGFTFRADPTARHADKRRVMAAAERALQGELGRRARALEQAPAHDLALAWTPGGVVGLAWQGKHVAVLKAGKNYLEPKIELAAGLEALEEADKKRVLSRLQGWLKTQLQEQLGALFLLKAAAENADRQTGLSGAGRGLAVQCIDHAGVLQSTHLAALRQALSAADRLLLKKAGVRLGVHHIFIPQLLKPAPSYWRLALWALHKPQDPCIIVEDGRVALPAQRTIGAESYRVAGYWKVGRQAVRVDMVERLAEALREHAKGKEPFVPSHALVSMMGLTREAFAGLMGALGYRQCLIDPPLVGSNASAHLPLLAPAAEQAAAKVIAFAWKGHRHLKNRPSEDALVGKKKNNAFAALAGLSFVAPALSAKPPRPASQSPIPPNPLRRTDRP